MQHALGVAQPEHRGHRVAHAADLGVDVHTCGLELSVEGVNAVGLQADAGLVATGLSARPGRGRLRSLCPRYIGRRRRRRCGLPL